MGRGSTSLLAPTPIPHARFMRLPRRAVMRSPSRCRCQTPSSWTSRPTAPNFSLQAALTMRCITSRTVPFGSYRSWGAHPDAWVTFAPQPQVGLKMGRRLLTPEGTASTGSRLTGANPERSSALLRVELPSFPVGHPTEGVCVSSRTPQRAASAGPWLRQGHFRRSPRKGEISTRCFPDGTSRPPNVVGVGRPTGSIFFSSHSGAEPRTSGRFGKREAFSGRSATSRSS
jgi:hypothetical protein